MNLPGIVLDHPVHGTIKTPILSGSHVIPPIPAWKTVMGRCYVNPIPYNRGLWSRMKGMKQWDAARRQPSDGILAVMGITEEPLPPLPFRTYPWYENCYGRDKNGEGRNSILRPISKRDTRTTKRT